jgi:hypothetical protein
LDRPEDKGPGKTPVSTTFHERLRSCNDLDKLGFEEWLFLPAMLFGSTAKWWGDRGKRDKPHEGLDLYLFRAQQGDIRTLDEKTMVPVLFEGQVVKISGDFLGESVFVGHNTHRNDGSQLHSIYGHVNPGATIRPGEELREGDIIGTIAQARRGGEAVPSHLHVSVAWIPDTLRSEELDWKTLGDARKVVLLDPLSVIVCPHSISGSVYPAGKSNCFLQETHSEPLPMTLVSFVGKAQSRWA